MRWHQLGQHETEAMEERCLHEHGNDRDYRDTTTEAVEGEVPTRARGNNRQ